MPVTQVRVHPKTKSKLNAFSKQRRMRIVDVVDVAMTALNALTPEQQEAVIRHGTIEVPQPAPSPS